MIVLGRPTLLSQQLVLL